MAVLLLRVLVLGAIAAAADDVPITWWSSPRASLQCTVPDADRLPVRRRPPPPLDGGQHKPKIYTWRRKEEGFKKIQNNGTLEVQKKKDGSTEGLYQCSLKHQAGYILGYPINLKFVHLDKPFLVRPESVSVNEGQPIAFTCDAGPVTVVSWLKDHEPLRNDNRYHYLKNQLLILDVREDDAGLYRCKTTNKTRTSHGGRLSVLVPEELAPGLLPLQHDEEVAVPFGAQVDLACPIVGYPKPELIWNFTPRGPNDRTQLLETTEEVYTLRNVDVLDEGVYTCSLEGRRDLQKVFNLTITEPAKITIPPTSKLVFRASTIRFNCSAVGRPPPTVTWYKDAEPLAPTGRIAVLPSVDGKRMELLIRSVTSEDAGIYQCFASNGHGVSSSWAWLNVTGEEAAAPSGVRCAAIDNRTVTVAWNNMGDNVLAYTVEITYPDATSTTWGATKNTEEMITLRESLTPYAFQIRVYSGKSQASDMSTSVICQGQGVPITLARYGDEVLISWRKFAEQTPGVKEWIVQYIHENSTEIHEVKLDGEVYNYTIEGTPVPQKCRVLGTKVLPWLQQNLTLVRWEPTSTASQGPEDGELSAIPQHVEITHIGQDEFSVRWRCEEADNSPERFSYMICVRKLDGDERQMCFESLTTSANVYELSPGSDYEVRVQARVTARNAIGDFSDPIYISTLSEGPGRFKDLTYKFLNATSLRVSWNSVPDKYTVHYSNELNLPISQWQQVDVIGNTVQLTDLDLTRNLYVMVKGYDPLGNSPILLVPVQIEEATDLTYSYGVSGALRVNWHGTGRREVRYSQNLTQPLDQWRTINVTENNVLLTDLHDDQVTYVMVIGNPGVPSQTRVLTVPARPKPPPETPTSTLPYIVGGAVGGILLLVLLAIAAVCLWRGFKRTRSPSRIRRRNESQNQGNHEEDAEMTSVGGRLANGGGSKEAGEPLLNGHVRITDNPNQSKAPNGRTRRTPYNDAFDVARYDDHDATLETVLNDSFQLLDTSRVPEFEPSRSQGDFRPNDSFAKLPDDNMNSELTRSVPFQVGNSNTLPTLQPNG